MEVALNTSSSGFSKVPAVSTGCFTHTNEGEFSCAVSDRKGAQISTDDSLDLWDELASEFDVNHASFEELSEISMSLYQAGQISLIEHAMLTFDPSSSTQGICVDTNLTAADAEGKMDWIAEYKARATRDLQIGDLSGYKNNCELLEILQRLS